MPVESRISFQVYHDQSELPAVLLLHGAGGSPLSFPPHMRRLPGCRVFAPDLPGRGQSTATSGPGIPAFAAAIAAWMKALNVRALVTGHSMGGAVALQLALDEPELVRGICLLGSAARLSVNPALLHGLSDPGAAAGAIEQVIDWSFGRSADARLKLLAGQRMAETPLHVLRGDFEACDRFDVTARLGQIHCPALVITGGQDRMTPVKMGRALVEGLPEARLEIIPEAGHFVMQEAPGIVTELLAGFVEQVYARGR